LERRQGQINVHHKNLSTPHFYKAHCRLGLQYKPIRATEVNVGVEYGPDAVLSSDFLKQFPDASVSELICTPPEDITGDYMTTALKEYRALRDLISQTLAPNERQIVIGGDHSISLPSAAAALARTKDVSQLGYLHIDSHGDINQASGSPTGNFHGMYLRPLFDKFELSGVDELVPTKLQPSQLLIIGNLDLDPAEQEYLDENNVARISRQEILADKPAFLQRVKQFLDQYPILHVSLDVDAFDQSLSPATGIPAKNGLFMEDIAEALALLKSHSNYSFDLSEVNPRKPGAEQTVTFAQNILQQVL
jgi:arginase